MVVRGCIYHGITDQWVLFDLTSGYERDVTDQRIVTEKFDAKKQTPNSSWEISTLAACNLDWIFAKLDSYSYTMAKLKKLGSIKSGSEKSSPKASRVAFKDSHTSKKRAAPDSDSEGDERDVFSQDEFSGQEEFEEGSSQGSVIEDESGGEEDFDKEEEPDPDAPRVAQWEDDDEEFLQDEEDNEEEKSDVISEVRTMRL